MAKIATVIGLLALLLGAYGAKKAVDYGKVHRAYMNVRSGAPSYDRISSLRDSLRGTCQGLALGSLVASIVAGALAFVAKRKDGELPLQAVACAALGLAGSIVVFAHDVF